MNRTADNPDLLAVPPALPGTRQAMRSRALRFVIMIGVLSFFADFTYEGSRSILGPYLMLLSASATTVGVVIGAAYDRSPGMAIGVCVTLQLSAVPVFLAIRRRYAASNLRGR